MPLREDGTACADEVFQDCGSFWFRTEDESSEGPFATADEADDAFRAYCKDLGL